MYLRDNMHLNLCQELKYIYHRPFWLCWLCVGLFTVIFPFCFSAMCIPSFYPIQSTATKVCPTQPHDSSNKITQGSSWCSCTISNDSCSLLFDQMPSALEKKSHALCSKLFLHWCSKSPRVCSPPVRQTGDFVTISVTFKMAVLDEFNMKMKFWLK